MKFAVLTHIVHKEKNGDYFSYEPYVREMNLWFKHVDEVRVVGSYSGSLVEEIETPYRHEKLTLKKIPSIDITSIPNAFKAVFKIPIILIKLFETLLWADHIHLRCPSNIGLLASFIQIVFPKKSKTVKYAGNWDPKSKQPWSYRLQKWILSNTFLTRNCKVLVYGDWPKQSKNVVPFFTATYSEKEVISIKSKNLDKQEVKLIYVGSLSPGKQPILALKVVQALLQQSVNVRLDVYGEGVERNKLETFISSNKLNRFIKLHGNVSKGIVKRAFQKSDFLIFLSKSEGWPKVVAEAMFWGCVPITTRVSCVPYMLGNGERGSLVEPEINSIVDQLDIYFKDNNLYQTKSKNAMEWARTYTLEYFSTQISELLND